uniref:Uncharacterized protein n=1 Tax=Mola mola TaxID=94237 RepID=A0A3Q3WKL2_MOLML
MMTRMVACTHQPSQDSNRTTVLRDEDCQNPKPGPVQACNRFDCPPMWDPHDWEQCSRSCGGGFQTRQVLCKQRLADGSILELPDTFCPSKSPASQQPCAKQECPPQWIMTNWSEKQGEDGRHWTVDPEDCSLIARPPRIRPCSLRLCESKRLPLNHCPQIAAFKSFLHCCCNDNATLHHPLSNIYCRVSILGSISVVNF